MSTAPHNTTRPCCQPTRAAGGLPTAVIAAEGKGVLRDAVPVPGGTALIGTASPILRQDAEGPLRCRKIKGFECERGAVTNAAFAAFVRDTGYMTEAERFGWSFVFFQHLAPELKQTQAVLGMEWWCRVKGACWRHPNGPLFSPAAPDHPVVQVSWNDATAFAGWSGGRLPSEAEWEHAARGGLGDVRYPWGDQDPNDTDFFPCNIWQGDFPNENKSLDGYDGTAPSISFEPNGYGLYNMVGNVWEWTREPFKVRSASTRTRRASTRVENRKLLKGGSFLCHASYCTRYRIAARTGNTPDSTSTHTGFRVIYANG